MKKRPLDSSSLFSGRIKAAAARIRLSLAARLVSLGQGVRMLVAAFRDLMRWQAHQRRAVRVQLGVIVLLLIWLCGVSAPTTVISSMTGGEGMVALLAAPTPTFTPSPMPTDTPTPPPPTPTSTATLIPPPTDTPTPPPPTPTPTEVPTDTPTPKPTPPPGTGTVAPTSTPTPIPPTPTPSPVPVTVAVYDMNDNPRDMNWVTQTYGSSIERATPGADGSVYRIVELRERTGPSSLDVYVIDANGNPVPGVQVRCWWGGGEDEQDEQVTNAEGRAGFGMGSYGGGYHIEVVMGVPSDIVWNLGMLGATEHTHLDTYFQLMP